MDKTQSSVEAAPTHSASGRPSMPEILGYPEAVEFWAEAKAIPLQAMSRARSFFRWSVGTQLRERDFDIAIDTARALDEAAEREARLSAEVESLRVQLILAKRSS